MAIITCLFCVNMKLHHVYGKRHHIGRKECFISLYIHTQNIKLFSTICLVISDINQSLVMVLLEMIFITATTELMITNIVSHWHWSLCGSRKLHEWIYACTLFDVKYWYGVSITILEFNMFLKRCWAKTASCPYIWSYMYVSQKKYWTNVIACILTIINNMSEAIASEPVHFQNGYKGQNGTTCIHLL